MEIPHEPLLPKIRRPICIIGASGIVRDAHLPAYRLAGYPVAAIYNRAVERERAEELAAQFQIPRVYTSLPEMIAAAPPSAVYDLAILAPHFTEALEQLPDGADVLIQKPMGDSLEQAQQILALCRKKRLTAAVNFQLRFAPFVRAARWLIEQGLLGEIYDMEVRVCVQTPWDLFPNIKSHPRLEIQQHSIHYIDLIRSFMGEPTRIFANTVAHPAKPMSSTRTMIGFDYGRSIRVNINTNHDHDFGPDLQESFIKWEGTRGAVKATMGLLMNYPAGVPDRFEFCLLNDKQKPHWQTTQLNGTWFPHAFIGTMSSLQRFAEGSDSILPTSVEDAVKTMVLVEASYEFQSNCSMPKTTGM